MDRATLAPKSTLRAPSLPHVDGREEPRGRITREALFTALDLLPDAVAVLDSLGGVLFTNDAFTRTLQGTADAPVVRVAMCETARLIAVGTSPEAVEGAARRALRGAEDGFRLVARRLELAEIGLNAAVLCVLHPLAPERPSDEALRSAFRLTRKEIGVARLLAEGRSNTGIAAELSISPHTARHHTERILAKLGVGSRAAVGPRLRLL